MNKFRAVVITLSVCLVASLGLNAYWLMRNQRVLEVSLQDVQSSFRTTGTRDPCIVCTLGGLDLSNEQRRSLTDHAEKLNSAEEQLDQRLAAKVKRLQQELRRPSSDPDQLEALLDDVTKLRRQRLDTRIRTILLVKQILTDDQLAQLAEAVQQARPPAD